MDKNLASRIARLETVYSNHISNCHALEKKKLTKHLQGIAGSSQTVSIGGSGFQCSCGYDELVKEIKKGVRQALKEIENG